MRLERNAAPDNRRMLVPFSARSAFPPRPPRQSVPQGPGPRRRSYRV